METLDEAQSARGPVAGNPGHSSPLGGSEEQAVAMMAPPLAPPSIPDSGWASPPDFPPQLPASSGEPIRLASHQEAGVAPLPRPLAGTDSTAVGGNELVADSSRFGAPAPAGTAADPAEEAAGSFQGFQRPFPGQGMVINPVAVTTPAQADTALEAGRDATRGAPEEDVRQGEWPEANRQGEADHGLNHSPPEPLHGVDPPDTGTPGDDTIVAGTGESVLAEVRDAWPRFVTVQEGDSFWSIAQRVYGDGNYFAGLYEVNRRRFPDYDVLPVGTVVECPRPELLRRGPSQRPDEAVRPAVSGATGEAARVYRIREGDSLFEIARRELGQAARYLEILQLNPAALPPDTGHLTRLPAGGLLVLPR